MTKTVLAAALALTCATLAHATGANAAKPTSADSAKAATSGKAAPAATKKISAAEAAEAAVVEQFVSLQDAAIATFLELGDTLQGVTDKASADEAAPVVKVAGEQLCTIISAVEALGEPSEAAQRAIMTRIANVAEKDRIVEQVMVPLLTLMMQEPPCYGSDALQTELTDLLANLQGAAGVDDEEGEGPEVAPLREPDADEAVEPADSEAN